MKCFYVWKHSLLWCCLTVVRIGRIKTSECSSSFLALIFDICVVTCVLFDVETFQQHIDKIKPTKKREKENCWSSALKSTLMFFVIKAPHARGHLISNPLITSTMLTIHSIEVGFVPTCLAKHKKYIDSTRKMLHNAVQPPVWFLVHRNLHRSRVVFHQASIDAMLLLQACSVPQ